MLTFRELSADERARDMFERREKGRRDFEMFMMGAEQKGRQEGYQEGLEEGRQEGRQEEKVAVARKLLRRNRPVDEIIEYTGLSCEEIEALRED